VTANGGRSPETRSGSGFLYFQNLLFLQKMIGVSKFKTLKVVSGIFLFSMISSCDCVQSANGIVLDQRSLQPIPHVAIGKYEKEDSNNSFSRRSFADENGVFEIDEISGGPSCGCPDMTLYFEKPGYKTRKLTFESMSEKDTIYLEKAPNR
jgi:hypothetical protein